ncbi:MAG: hypothetical protein MUC69_02590 [Gemmatimonadales bacterium]|jgi:hypothetical protein|nr:hypothetical protein [Gemmatimonadales bacterium]
MTEFVRALRLYRLWRTAAVLCAVGAVEFAWLAWSRRQWPIWLAVVLLVGVAVVATRRAAAARRAL